MLCTEMLSNLIGMVKPTLVKWVDEGVVKPVQKGRRGGNPIPHLFSPQQSVALAVVAGLKATPRGCDRAYAKELIANFEQLSDEALFRWLGEEEGEFATPATMDGWRYLLSPMRLNDDDSAQVLARIAAVRSPLMDGWQKTPGARAGRKKTPASGRRERLAR